MKIALGCDHGGYELKEIVKANLLNRKYAVEDFGCYSLESVDYPDYAQKVTSAVINENYTYGILICGTGIGISIAANKVTGIRAALCTSTIMGKMSREHNDANILCLGGRTTSPELAIEIVQTFLDTPFEGGRHQKRLDKFQSIN
ncbi:MAG: ribose 5-phosphate isomerase B [Candidatus Margulisbacteria bacterium GWE2_39_32]|nr:MAG: ribose 5-phosphate isomerase B [Candidatus Margulisbacteria bacterium GWE2_39_32]